MVAHTYSPSTGKIEAGGSPQVQAQARLQNKSDVRLDDIVSKHGQQGEAAQQSDHWALLYRNSIAYWHVICHKWHFIYCLPSHTYSKIGQ